MSIWLYNNGQIVVASTGWLLHCILSHRLCLLTRRRLACCLLRHLCLTSASSPSLASQFSSPPNARRTLPAAALPTATVPFRTALVLQHVRLRTGSRVASCGIFTLNLPAHPLLHPLFAPRPLPASSNARRTLPVAASPTATVPSCTALVIQHVHLRHHIVIFTAQPSTILAQLLSYLGGR